MAAQASAHPPPMSSESEAKWSHESQSPSASLVPALRHKVDDDAQNGGGQPMQRDWRFWCIILSLAICMVLTAMEFSSVATALPVIAQELEGTQYIWVGSAYNLGSTVLLPFCGGLAQVSVFNVTSRSFVAKENNPMLMAARVLQIFGRRAVMLLGIAIFSIGSALCGAATSMNFLIGGRTVQGLGAGAITALIQIIIADLVPLKDRGAFNGIIALLSQFSAFAIGSGTGPVVGGALAQHGQWRWLFYLNLPICAVAAILVAVFLRLKTPTVPFGEKMRRLDWIGNAIIVSSTTSIVIALTWAGTQHPWSSPKVLVPLIVGFAGLAGFLIYEANVPEYPIVPISLMKSRTALSGYTQNFFNGIVLSTLAYWLPSFFQACKDASPIAAGVDIFGASQTIAPSSLVAGLIIQRFSRYRQPMWFGWSIVILGAALYGQINENTSRATNFGVQVLLGVGIGINYVAAYFPVLAPIPVTQSAPALAFFVFLRNFALIWGVTIGGTIVQNQLASHLPPDFLARFPSSSGSHGAEIAFEVIPRIRHLPQPLKDQVRAAFAQAFQVVWNTLAGLGGLGLLVSFAMKALPLHTQVDEAWGRETAKSGAADVEAGREERKDPVHG
ncbi:Iron permease [Mycena indigotica]|uniref:Iron permease n=1 Tax=Mycena indigotica TaxID=2126181 RepID=A0A8H6RZI6_9AGAR|nr:Iron permease [Mycena indigotica]KAF7289732.1 Iron permease [Mycena indigotica]